MKINFWLERYPFAIVGLLKPLKEKLGLSLQIFVNSEFNSNRKNLDIGSNDLFDIKFVDVKKDLQNYDLDNSINIVNGFNSSFLLFLKKQKKTHNLKIGIFTELPCPMGNAKAIKKIYLYFKYKNLIKSNIEEIDFLLPIGENAISYYSNIGWNKPSFPLFYLTNLNLSERYNLKKCNDGCYCYIGRNNYKNKGLKSLLKVFKRNKSLKLLIVGDYGEDSIDVNKQVSKCENITRVKSVLPEELTAFLNKSNVKCIVVPSKIDGWNPNIYISLLLGVPCIATNKTGSNYLIERYSYGFVSKCNHISLEKAISKMEKMTNAEREILLSNASYGKSLMEPDVLINSLINFLKSL